MMAYYGISIPVNTESKSNCGYCKGVKTCRLFGFYSTNISPSSYQLLLERGLRRSGIYFYVADPDICCPAFAIRCDATEFKLSKSQRSVIKRVNSFLRDGTVPKRIINKLPLNPPSENLEGMDLPHVNLVAGDIKNLGSFKLTDERNESNETVPVDEKKDSLKTQVDLCKAIERINKLIENPKKRKSLKMVRNLEKMVSKHNLELETAKKIMAERFMKKIANRNKSCNFDDLIDLPNDMSGFTHKLTFKIIQASDSNFDLLSNAEHKLFAKYQTQRHKENPSDCSLSKFKNWLSKSPFMMEDEVKYTNDGLPLNEGCYHVQYWLDDSKLIAVSVLDLLPQYLSSKYLFYDPDYNFLNLGIYSSLREILWVRKLNKVKKQLKYSCLGLYIHGCSKMNYKGNYKPSYLLCRANLRWYPIEQCRSILNDCKTLKFDDMDAGNREECDVTDRDILILYNSQIINLRNYIRLNGEKHRNLILNFARNVGKEFLKHNLLILREDLLCPSDEENSS